MGFPAGVGRDFEALERRRMRAGSLLTMGLSQSEVARRVGAHRQSVSKWAAELATKGRAGLKSAGRAGRKPRLSAEQISQIEQGLKRGPQALGYETSLWTANRVVHLIEQACGVSYHPEHVWKILRRLGWSCQRPAGRALGGGEKIINAGRRGGGRRQKKAKNQDRIIVFIDESGLSERPHRCRIWAPRGHTQMLQYHFNWKTLSTMSG